MAVRTAVPFLGRKEKLRLHCSYGKAHPPAFTLTFPDGSLVPDQVDTTRSCLVMFEFTNQTIVLTASIQAVKDTSVLELVARETVTHTHARNYFRVDAATKIAASAILEEETKQELPGWRLDGDTIDLSGSGVLCSFSEPLEQGVKAKIELTLPTRDMEVIESLGHVVRCRKIDNHFYHIALHFDEIDSESQDKIMACCFELQRRYLRMRVRLESINAA
ncbi:MAG: PilZ domain-containing protein [Proteobacteria bacterium]|nr:PilZ domain-containing protein [Pseudomonadota bacterium]